jgi:hypothetical protein
VQSRSEAKREGSFATEGKGWPHWAQNLAANDAGFPQWAQILASGAAHCSQNLASTLFLCRQLGHFMEASRYWMCWKNTLAPRVIGNKLFVCVNSCKPSFVGGETTL